MKRLLSVTGTVLLAMGVLLSAPPADRWLHVRVAGGKGEGETIRVNVPLSFAEKVLPAIQVDKLRNGKVKLGQGTMDGVDLRAVLEAVRDTQDGEFVTVEEGGDNVRVAKEKGYLLAKVREGKNTRTKVDVKIPLSVVEALLSGRKDELDLGAGVRALSAHGDVLLVTVNDEDSTVRVWVDSQNVSD